MKASSNKPQDDMGVVSVWEIDSTDARTCERRQNFVWWSILPEVHNCYDFVVERNVVTAGQSRHKYIYNSRTYI